jgi:hypothetical protein
MREAVLIDLPRNPGNYVAAAVQADAAGKPVVVVQNRAGVALSAIAVTPVMVNASGQIVQQGRTLRVDGPLQAGARVALDAGLGSLDQAQLAAVRVRIDGARVAQ